MGSFGSFLGWYVRTFLSTKGESITLYKQTIVNVVHAPSNGKTIQWLKSAMNVLHVAFYLARISSDPPNKYVEW